MHPSKQGCFPSSAPLFLLASCCMACLAFVSCLSSVWVTATYMTVVSLGALTIYLVSVFVNVLLEHVALSRSLSLSLYIYTPPSPENQKPICSLLLSTPGKGLSVYTCIVYLLLPGILRYPGCGSNQSLKCLPKCLPNFMPKCLPKCLPVLAAEM